MTERTCSIDGCESPVLAHGWCNRHYLRWRRHGDPTVDLRSSPRPDRETVTCTIEGCDRPHEARGWCQMHYFRWLRHGDPTMRLLPERDPVCSVEGCDRPHAARGYCATHYWRWRNHGDPRGEMPIGYGGLVPIAPLPSPLTRTDRAIVAQTVRVACDGAEGGASYWTNDERFWARVRRLDAHDAAVYGDELALAAD